MDTKAEINALITRIESFRAGLQDEQDQSEAEHEDWENDEDEEKGDEPGVVNNEAEVDNLSRALNFLEKAVDELDD